MTYALNISKDFPKELTNYILSYDKRFVIRNGEIVVVLPIPKSDKRYTMLQEIPEKQIYPWWSCVDLLLNNNITSYFDFYYVLRYEFVEEEKCVYYYCDKKMALRSSPNIYSYEYISKNNLIMN
jgi:hypothetical protein